MVKGRSLSHVRIIGGDFKRRNIDFIGADGLRPTPDRLRETLFNWLMWDIPGKVVVDLCAGSGILGFESWSRGAARVIWVEPLAKQAERIAQHIATLQQNALHANTQTTLINTKAQSALAQIQQLAPIDILFLDPPYQANLWAELLTLYSPLLAPGALVYIEAPMPLSELGLPTNLQLLKSTQVGQISAGLYAHRPAEL